MVEKNETERIDLSKIKDSNLEERDSTILGKTIATKIPLNLYEEVSYLVENGSYLSISDFLRESMREHLKRIKISKTRNIKFNEAKVEILNYFKEYQDCYLDEIAFDLNLDFLFVLDILNQLLLEKRIRVNKFSNLKSEVDFESNTKKLKGKRLIVEAKSVDNEFIRIDSIKSINIKNKGFILENGVVILSNHYSFIK